MTAWPVAAVPPVGALNVTDGAVVYPAPALVIEKLDAVNPISGVTTAPFPPPPETCTFGTTLYPLPPLVRLKLARVSASKGLAVAPLPLPVREIEASPESVVPALVKPSPLIPLLSPAPPPLLISVPPARLIGSLMV